MRVTSVPNGAGRIDVTITPGRGSLRSIRIGTPTNARVDVGNQYGVASNTAVTLPASSQQAAFVINLVNLGASMTVPYVATDDCGEWSSFVGSGALTLPAGAQVVTFDDRTGQNQALPGQYPSGVIDWGTSGWYHSGPFGAFTSRSVSFTSSATSKSFTFVTPRRLASLQAYNGGNAGSTVTLSCAGQPTKTVTVGSKQLTSIATGWTGTCTTVTITSSNGWDTNFDNFVVAGS